MSDINEKDILNSIKKSVENETPDVWKNIESAEKCIYDFDIMPPKSKIRKPYLSVAAVAACVLITVVGLRMKYSNTPKQLIDLASGSGMRTVQPGAPEIAIGRDSVGGDALIFKPFAKDADAKEASSALKIDIITPDWLPEGYTKASAKLFSNTEDFSHPYMYNVEYTSPAKKVLTLTITKYMTEEEKIKSQPGSNPVPADKGTTGSGRAIAPVPPDKVINDAPSDKSINPASSDKVIVTAALPPDTPVQSRPGNTITEPAAPLNSTEKPAIAPGAQDLPVRIAPGTQDLPARIDPEARELPSSSGAGKGSAGNTGSAPSREPASVEFTKVKINETDVTLTVTSSKEFGSVSAYWVYRGGNYNLFSNGISKDDILRMIKSMIQ